MKQLKLNQKSAQQILADDILSFFDISEYKDILQFALQDIDLSDDVSADKSRIDLQNYPHIIQPLSKCVIQKGKRKQVCLSFPEQMSKTTCEMIAILYALCFDTLQILMAYPSQQLAVQTATVKFIPLMKKINQLQKDLQQPLAVRSDRVKLSNGILYWQGAGTKIVSKSAKLVLGDETSIWQCPNANNIEEMKKRTRSYNECLQLFVSTPRYKQDHFWRQFLQGSQGYYYLRCQHCNQLTMRSADINNLQFESVYNDELKQYVVVRGSERMICPKCKHEHSQADRQAMIKQGAYIHKFPDRVELNPSYQCGVLASLLNVHSWSAIADATLSQGKQAELQDFISYDNSIRGLPFQQRNYNKQDETAISQHFFNPDDLKKDDIQAIYIAADSQDTFFPCGVFALDVNNNVWLLEVHRIKYLYLNQDDRKVINMQNKQDNKQPVITMMDLLDKQYFGIRPLMLLQDMRGHVSEQVKKFASMRKNILLYGGTNLKWDKFKVSDNNYKLFLCNAKTYQAELIFRLYYQKNKQNSYLFLPKTLSDKDIEEITSFQPDDTVRNGGQFENWTPKDKVHDLFDVIKMAYCAIDISAKIYKAERFIHHKASIFNRIEKKKTKIIKKTVARKPVFRT